MRTGKASSIATSSRGNILLDGRGEPLVSDFGLAKWLDTSSDLTRTLTIFGTPGYIAPEQAQGSAATLKPTSDIYSLGAILFDLLTGQPPFLGEHALAVIHQAAEKPAPKLRSLVKGADKDLETICTRCLEREPVARYRSAGDLAEDLERWLEGRPILARPVLPPTRLWRWSKRNPRMAGTVAGCAALGLFALAALLSRQKLDTIVRREEAAARSLLTLPFEDLDTVNPNSRSAGELTDKLQSELTHSARVRVIPVSDKVPKILDPWKEEEWQELGSKLGARNLLHATIRMRNGKKRVTAQLVDGVSGAMIKRWIYDAGSDQYVLQSLTAAVAAIIEARARHETPPSTPNEIPETDFVAATTKPIARNYYIAARELRSRLNVSDFDRAIVLFEKAIEEDPKYAAAYAMLASACQSRSEIDPSKQWLERGNAAAAIAVRLAPFLAEAQRAQAGTFRYRGQLKEGLDAYLAAYELDQTSDRAAATIGNVEGQLGRPDLALRWYEKAVRRESRPGIYTEYFGDALSDLGEYARAEAAFHSAAVFRPDLAGATMGLARLAMLQGDFDRARRGCEEAERQFPDEWEPKVMAAEIEFYARHFGRAEERYQYLLARDRTNKPLLGFAGPIRFPATLGFVQAARGDIQGKALLEEARSLDLKDLETAPENPRLLYSLAAECAAFGEKEQSLNHLQQAGAAGWIDFRSLALDPRFDSIRDTARYQEILFQLRKKVMAMDATVSGRESGQSNL